MRRDPKRIRVAPTWMLGPASGAHGSARGPGPVVGGRRSREGVESPRRGRAREGALKPNIPVPAQDARPEGRASSTNHGSPYHRGEQKWGNKLDNCAWLEAFIPEGLGSIARPSQCPGWSTGRRGCSACFDRRRPHIRTDRRHSNRVRSRLDSRGRGLRRSSR